MELGKAYGRDQVSTGLRRMDRIEIDKEGEKISSFKNELALPRPKQFWARCVHSWVSC